MGTGQQVTDNAAAKIVQATKLVLAEAIDQTGDPGTLRSYGSAVRWGKIASISSGKVNVNPCDPAGTTSTSDTVALPITSIPCCNTTGDLVRYLPCTNNNGDGTQTGILLEPIVGLLIGVKLTMDSGYDGDASTAASYTYTATSISGTTLGSSLSPVRPRPYGTMTAATDGIGYWTTDGTFVLQDAYEYPGSSSCPGGS